MSRFRHTILVVMAVGLILLCGMLPSIAGKLQDSLEGTNVALESVKTVQFSHELTDFEKLSLIRYGEMAEVSAEKTKMQTKQVQVCALSIINLYQENGLIPHVIDIEDAAGALETFSFQVKPVLLYDTTSSEQRGIFWLVDIKSVDDLHFFSMCIDDQDGKLMIISYLNHEENRLIAEDGNTVTEDSGYNAANDSNYTNESIHTMYQHDKEELLEKFCTTYFSQIALWKEDQISEIVERGLFSYEGAYGNVGTDGTYYISDVEVTKEYAAVTFFWGDTKDGALDMHFAVHANGFYNEWQ